MFSLRRAQDAAIAEIEFAGRTAADPPIGAKKPIIEIVLTLITRLSIGRGLILLIADGA